MGVEHFDGHAGRIGATGAAGCQGVRGFACWGDLQRAVQVHGSDALINGYRGGVLRRPGQRGRASGRNVFGIGAECDSHWSFRYRNGSGSAGGASGAGDGDGVGRGGGGRDGLAAVDRNAADAVVDVGGSGVGRGPGEGGGLAGLDRGRAGGERHRRLGAHRHRHRGRGRSAGTGDRDGISSRRSRRDHEAAIHRDTADPLIDGSRCGVRAGPGDG